MKKHLILVLLFAILTYSCKNSSNNQTTGSESNVDDSTVSYTVNDTSNTYYSPNTTNPITAEKIKNFLALQNKSYYNDLTDQDKKFSFYEIDLNGDSLNEYIIYLEGPYFCGSGGCSFYLLNNDFKVNTYFTVTDPPIFRSSNKTNGWNDLILYGDFNENGGVKNFIHLRYDNAKKQYPQNPSLIKKIDIAPSGEDYVMWKEGFSEAKKYTF